MHAFQGIHGRFNVITATDSYKQTHWRMYPPGLEFVESYFESRAGGEYDETVFFGLHHLLKAYLEGIRVTQGLIDQAEELCKLHFGQNDKEIFNRAGWERILHTHGGRLPISIRAVPEGTVVPESNALFVITNTDPAVPWLVNHLETILVELWYPCTVATISRMQKKVLKKALERSGTTDALPDKLHFMLHDFGFRGSSSIESAAIGGAAHLVNFVGTDTLAAIELLQQYYSAEMAGWSVPAAEHSTITAWGREGETDAYRHILEQFPRSIVSVVSDSWDVENACREIWGKELHSDIVFNAHHRFDGDGQTLVIRPDSGNPEIVLPQLLDILGKAFGYSENEKGFKVLPDCIRMIQGDGINRRSLPSLLDAIMEAGWSLDNFVFGSGGGLLQDCTRDTLRFAMKCSWVQIDGVGRRVQKQPKTDPTKNSKAGRLKLIKVHEPWSGNVEVWDTFKTVTRNQPGDDQLVEVFRDGVVLVNPTLEEIRERAELP